MVCRQMCGRLLDWVLAGLCDRLRVEAMSRAEVANSTSCKNKIFSSTDKDASATFTSFSTLRNCFSAFRGSFGMVFAAYLRPSFLL